MSFRTSTYGYSNNYMKDLQISYGNYSKLLEQADGSKLHRASDDSVGYGKYLRYQNTITSNIQYQSNTTTALAWMKNTDSVLVNVTGSLGLFSKKVIEAGNSTNNASDMKDIGKELLSKVQEVVQDLNIQIGERYLFSGQSDNIMPFTMSDEKQKRGLAKTLDAGEKQYFGNTTDNSGTVTQFLTLNGSDGNTYFLNTNNGKIYTEEFVNEGYKTKVSEGFKTVQTGDEVATLAGLTPATSRTFVSDNFSNNGVIKSGITGNGDNWSQAVTVNGNSVTMTFATIEQYVVDYNGDSKKLSMVTEDGMTRPVSDSVNLTGQEVFGSDIFDLGEPSGSAMLNNLLAVVSQVDNAQFHWVSSDATTISDAAYSKVLGAETKLAARNQAYQAIDTVLDTQEESITGSISAVADADVADLATKLTNYSKTYSLALTLGSRTLPMSLVDYLR